MIKKILFLIVLLLDIALIVFFQSIGKLDSDYLQDLFFFTH